MTRKQAQIRYWSKEAVSNCLGSLQLQPHLITSASPSRLEQSLMFSVLRYFKIIKGR